MLATEPAPSSRSEQRSNLPNVEKGSSEVPRIHESKQLFKPSSLTLPVTATSTNKKSRSNSAPLVPTGAIVEEVAQSSGVNVASLVVVGGLGQGGFADVVEVKDMQTGENFAMKVIAKRKLKKTKSRQRLNVELIVMTKTKPSPFVQRCHGCFESATNIFFVLDLNLGGDLYTHLVSRYNEIDGGKFPESECRVLLAELVLALEHVHEQGFIHKDVKIENVMLTAKGHVKLVDFGLAEVMQVEVGFLETTGSLTYMAPELLMKRSGGRHTDWWAVGILAHEILTGYTPWSSLTDEAVIKEEIQLLDIVFPGDLSGSAQRLLRGLLNRDYKNRLGTKVDKDIRKAQFFSSVDWEATARLECAPAFIPAKDATAQDQKQKVLASYVARREVSDGGETDWYMGVDRVKKHPRFQSSTMLLPMLKRG